MSMDYLIFDGFNTLAVDARVFQKNVRPSPEKIYEKVEVAGRNGTILYDTGRWSDVEVEYSFIIRENVRENVVALRNALLAKSGYKRLMDSYNYDEIYEAYYNGSMTVMYSRGDTMAKGTLTFMRRPERFLASGDKAITITDSSATVRNPTSFDAKPLIRVVGTGTFTIGGNTVTISSNSTYIDIDSERQDCYCGTDNKNGAVAFSTGEFPVFVPGNNTITKSGITSLTITPRWWRL